MFIHLIESKRQRNRSIGGTTLSVALHAALITFAAYVTAHAGEIAEQENPEVPIPIFTAPPPDAPPAPAPKPPPDDEPIPPLPHKGYQELTASTDIPDSIPPIDLSHELTNEDDFPGKGPRDGRAIGVDVGAATRGDHPYFEFQVEKPALAREGNPAPRYPSMLESSGVEGEVLAQFVVDTSGRADMRTLQILRASNDLFASALQSVLPKWRFYPAEAGGRKVKQIVQMPLRFVAPPR